jgi:hypothetical protein
VSNLIVSMPPKASAKAAAPNVKNIAQKKRTRDEKLSEAASPSKRPKKTDSGGNEKGCASSPAKPITPAKCVINLHDSVMKVSPETFINPTARKFFREAEVHFFLVRVPDCRHWMNSAWPQKNFGSPFPRTVVPSCRELSTVF